MDRDFNTHGGYFAPQGYLRIDAGGSHEENPNGGVQVGVDSQGIPNLLEEGEPVYNDYVFSDNIRANKTLLKKYNIPEKFEGKLYSEIADAYVDEAAESPNDPISNKGLEAMLDRLAGAQEEQKMIKQQKELQKELESMSPEELAELEALLSQQEGEAVEMANGGKLSSPVNTFVSGGLEDVLPFHANLDSMTVFGDDKRKKYIFPNQIVPQDAIEPIDNKFGMLTPREFTPSTYTVEEFEDMENSNESGKESSYWRPLPTWPRYAGAITAGLLGLHNAFQEPDKYNIPTYQPILPSGNLSLNRLAYNPIDENQLVNDVMANSAATARGLRSAGLGPSTGAVLLAADYNAGNNIAAARAKAFEDNNRLRNEVLNQHNASTDAESKFDYTLSRDRSQVLNDARLRNIQNSILQQRLNYEAEAQKYAAIQKNLDSVAEALAGIGKENFAMNQIASAYDYAVLPDGTKIYIGGGNDKKCGGFIKSYKKR